MKISFMQRLSLGVVSAVVLFAVMLTFMTGIITAVNNIALAVMPPGSPAPFAQPWYEMLISFAVGFIPIATVVWEHQNGKEQSFMERLTLAILVAIILFGTMLAFMTGIVLSTNGIALYYGATTAPFAQPYYELLVSFAVALIPIAIEIEKHMEVKAAKPEVEATAPGPPTSP